MAISVLSKSTPYPIDAGQLGIMQQDFVCAWSTTDTTGTVPSGLRKVTFVDGFCSLQETGDDEGIDIVNSLNGDGSLVLATGGLISLKRKGFSPTSAAKFTFSIKGYR